MPRRPLGLLTSRQNRQVLWAPPLVLAFLSPQELLLVLEGSLPPLQAPATLARLSLADGLIRPVLGLPARPHASASALRVAGGLPVLVLLAGNRVLSYEAGGRLQSNVSARGTPQHLVVDGVRTLLLHVEGGALQLRVHGATSSAPLGPPTPLPPGHVGSVLAASLSRRLLVWVGAHVLELELDGGTLLSTQRLRQAVAGVCEDSGQGV